MCFPAMAAAIPAITGAVSSASSALAPLATVAGLVGTGVSAYGAYQQGQALEAQSKVDAQVADANAEAQRLEGTERANMARRRARRAAASGRAAAGASGLDPNSGSAALVISDIEKNGFLDATTAIWNAENRAVNFDNQARSSRANARASRRAGGINTAATVLTGLSRIK